MGKCQILPINRPGADSCIYLEENEHQTGTAQSDYRINYLFADFSSSDNCIDSDFPFLHPHDKFWALYLSNAKELDKTRMERWRGASDGILIFVRSPYRIVPNL